MDQCTNPLPYCTLHHYIRLCCYSRNQTNTPLIEACWWACSSQGLKSKKEWRELMFLDLLISNGSLKAFFTPTPTAGTQFSWGTGAFAVCEHCVLILSASETWFLVPYQVLWRELCDLTLFAVTTCWNWSCCSHCICVYILLCTPSIYGCAASKWHLCCSQLIVYTDSLYWQLCTPFLPVKTSTRLFISWSRWHPKSRQ